ncbi:MAG: deoxyribonuclease IV [Gaiellaceae bacterium]
MLAGAHVSTAGGIHTAIDRAVERGAESVQVFTQSPRAWRPTNHPPQNIERFKQARAEAGIGAVVCHAVYLINLAATDKNVRAKSHAALVQTVEVACAIEAEGVVLHVGSHLGAGFEAGLEAAVPALEEALGACDGPTRLLVENSAGAGDTIGRSLKELGAVFDRLDHHPRLGLCLDSCHLWVSGVDVTDPAVYAAVLDTIDERMGLDRLRCLHVNDAAAELGSNRDRHANVLDGTMGEGLGVFLADPRVQGLPAILETPGPDNHGPDAAEVQRLKDLHARATGATRPGRSARRPGRKASRGGARKTRG